MPDTPDRYSVDAILRACEVLHSFRFDEEVLSLSEVVDRTGIHKATAFRTLHSLIAGGLLERAAKDRYRVVSRRAGSKRVRIGYAAMTENSVFSRDVSDGLRRAAQERGVDLIECDNRYSAKVAIRNAEFLVREKVDLAIEVQIHERTAPVVAARFQEAGIPLIAVDIPHPGAVFFGGNNYLAGRIGGRALGQWAQAHWKGEVDAVVLLGLVAAGAVPAARMTGVAVGLKEILPHVGESELVRLDGKGGYVESLEALRKYLVRSKARRILVGAQNDASALGALRALEEAGRDRAAVVGQNATAAGRAELRRAGTKLIGSVAFFPEAYGPQLIDLAFLLLQGKPVPPAVFVKHTLITAGNVDHHYPNDAMLTVPDADALLWKFFH